MAGKTLLALRCANRIFNIDGAQVEALRHSSAGREEKIHFFFKMIASRS
jgi:hypothetical protein